MLRDGFLIAEDTTLGADNGMGVVETSNNLGMVDLKPSGGTCNFMVRSLLDSGSQTLADEIISLWALSGTVAESTVQVIHAGLECGIRGAHAPGESVDVASVARTWQLLTAILAAHA